MTPRIANDKYFTPAVLTEGLLARVPIKGRVIEPCAGEGAIAKVLFEHGLDVTLSDITGVCDAPTDASTPEFWEYHRGYDWAISNPPYGGQLPDKIVPLAFDNVTTGVAMLLRITWSEPCASRGNWLEEHADCLRAKNRRMAPPAF
jgi:hypothetical protein